MNVKRAIIFLILAVCIVTLVSRLVHLQYFKDALHLKRNDNETDVHHNRTNFNIDVEYSQIDSFTIDANLNVSDNADEVYIDNKLYRMKYDRKRRNSSSTPLSDHNDSNSNNNEYGDFILNDKNNTLYTISDKNISQIDYEKRDKVKQVHL